jgi:hypothetical protein
VLKTLTDDSPERRAAAAVALARAGAKDALPAVRGLLKDPAPVVRLHVGLALVAADDKDAVPALIDLFDKLPRSQLARAEDVVYELAGDRAPGVALGDAAANRAFREAWQKWWREHGGAADLAVLKRKAPRDFTLVVLLDKSEVIELDPADKERFKIEKAAFPLDAQPLTGDRVLLAEHGANRVTERLRDGTVLWEKSAAEPLAAKRLPGGHTFIGTKTHLLIVDRDGREVFVHACADGSEGFMRANRLDDGTFAVITHEQRFVRLDAAGKELSAFPVTVHTSGGRIDVQPDGKVLVPSMYNNRVYEFDQAGKPVREFTINQPIVATRLPNGHTLITSMTENRAVEFDLAGKQVWEYKANTRVTRVYRR